MRGDKMNKYLELLVGVVLVLLSVYLALPAKFGGMQINILGIDLSQAVAITVLGGIILAVFFFGAIFLMLGIMDLKE